MRVHVPNGRNEGGGEGIIGEAEEQATLTHTCHVAKERHGKEIHDWVHNARQACVEEGPATQNETCLAAGQARD